MGDILQNLFWLDKNNNLTPLLSIQLTVVGFGYTLKQLTTIPGKIQKRYLAGDRIKHQKLSSSSLFAEHLRI